MKNLSKEEVRTAEEMTAHGIALKFAEIFQDHYPKKPLWKMMDDLRQDIETYASQFKSKSEAVGEQPAWDELRRALQLVQNTIEELDARAGGTSGLKEAWNLISDFITANEVSVGEESQDELWKQARHLIEIWDIDGLFKQFIITRKP